MPHHSLSKTFPPNNELESPIIYFKNKPLCKNMNLFPLFGTTCCAKNNLAVVTISSWIDHTISVAVGCWKIAVYLLLFNSVIHCRVSLTNVAFRSLKLACVCVCSNSFHSQGSFHTEWCVKVLTLWRTRLKDMCSETYFFSLLGILDTFSHLF